MSIAQHRALEAIAVELLAVLDGYEQHLDALLREPDDERLLQAVAADMDLIQRGGTALPMLSVPVVALMISHAELIFGIARRPGRPRADLVEANVDHLRALRRACVRLVEMEKAGVN